VVFLLLLLGSAAGAVAQQNPASPAAPATPANPTVQMASRGAIGQLNAQQTLGLRLFNQSCQVCHTQALLNSALWGPALSQESLGGDDKALHDKIVNGSDLMPGWKYKYSAAEIDAIVAYVKTMPKQVAVQPRPSSAGEAGQRGAD
jgi:mono/diheme cytochrome c family protein